MTTRDRIVVGVIAAALVLAGFWFFVLTPKREESAKLSDAIAVQETRLTAAESSAAAAADAKAEYEADYAAVARLGQAVPADDDVPSLVYQLDRAALNADVDFRSLKLSAASGNAGKPAAAPAPATATSAAALPPGASVGSAGFPTMPFSFVFDGSFFDMEKFLGRVSDFTKVSADEVEVSGRLLTVDSIELSAGRAGFPQVSATIQATAYVLPAGEGVTNGATPEGPKLVSDDPPSGSGGGTAGTPASAAAAPLATGGK